MHHGYKFNKIEGLFDNYVNFYYNLKSEAKLQSNKGLYHLSKLMLNSLYGRMGLKYNDTETKIISSTEGNDIKLKYRVIENHSLNIEKDLEYIKYLRTPSSNLYDMNKELYIEEYLKSQLTHSEFISRSVQIAIFTTTYASIFMNKFLNIPGNPCFYSDTDSIFLQHPLESQYVGNDIGQFKLEGVIKQAFFIAPKLYCLVKDNGEIIIKAKGVDKNKLTIDDFKNLLSGSDVGIETTQFKTSWVDYSVSLQDQIINIRPILLKRDYISSNRYVSDTKPVKVVNGSVIRTPPMTSVKLNK